MTTNKTIIIYNLNIYIVVHKLYNKEIMTLVLFLQWWRFDYERSERDNNPDLHGNVKDIKSEPRALNI